MLCQQEQLSEMWCFQAVPVPPQVLRHRGRRPSTFRQHMDNMGDMLTTPLLHEDSGKQIHLHCCWGLSAWGKLHCPRHAEGVSCSVRCLPLPITVFCSAAASACCSEAAGSHGPFLLHLFCSPHRLWLHFLSHCCTRLLAGTAIAVH